MSGRSATYKALCELENEHGLEDLFEEPKISDDDLETEEENAPYSTVRLQKILENLDDPAMSPHLRRNPHTP